MGSVVCILMQQAYAEEESILHEAVLGTFNIWSGESWNEDALIDDNYKSFRNTDNNINAYQ